MTIYSTWLITLPNGKNLIPLLVLDPTKLEEDLVLMLMVNY